jgi:hypothetical protein
MDEFNNDFYFIKGAVDLTRVCFSNNGDDVSDESVAAIFEEVKGRLEKVENLIDRVFHSIRELKKLSPEQEKKRKMLEDQNQRESIQAIGKIGEKFEKKMIKTLERR